VFFDSQELGKRAWEHVERFRDGGPTRLAEIENAFTYFLASGADAKRLDDYLREQCSANEKDWRPYLDLFTHLGNQLSCVTSMASSPVHLEASSFISPKLQELLGKIPEEAFGVFLVLLCYK